MTFTTQDVRQGINSTNHVVSKMLLVSTTSTFFALAFIALS